MTRPAPARRTGAAIPAAPGSGTVRATPASPDRRGGRLPATASGSPSGYGPRSGFWSALGQAERTTLRSAARSRHYPARTPLCYQGDESDHVIIIVNGWAKVTVASPDGTEVVLAVRGPGDLVGEGVLVGRRQRSASVTALGPVQTLVIPAARFSVFLDRHPQAWRLLSGTVVHRLDDADRRLQAHASADGAQRLAHLLLYLTELSQQYDAPGPHGAIAIKPPLSQEELGSWVDASRETVARALKLWRRNGIVQTGWRRITVVDRPGLQVLAGVPSDGS